MPRRLFRMLAGFLGFLLVLAVPAPASSDVRTFQSWNFSAKGAINLRGHGYGHGHGMSQHGAQGAALRGRTERQILAFYYPGTSLARFTSNVAVWISGDWTDDLQVRWQTGLRATDRGTSKTYALPNLANVSRWRFQATSRGTVLQYLRDGRWRLYRTDGRYALEGDGQFSAPSGRLTILLPRSVPKTYRGVMRHARPAPDSRQRDTVNVLSIDEYVQGVVPAEMPASWEPEAVQSQAIAARTYALHEREANLGKHYQICDTTRCQVYSGVAGEHPDGNRAVAATSQLYLQYDGKPAFTQFSASSGGRLSAGSRPYLVSKDDPYDDWAGNTVHDWTARIYRSTLERRFPGIGRVRGISITHREGGGEWKGRVTSVTVRGADGNRVITGNEMRSIYGLRSTFFTRN